MYYFITVSLVGNDFHCYVPFIKFDVSNARAEEKLKVVSLCDSYSNTFCVRSWSDIKQIVDKVHRQVFVQDSFKDTKTQQS